MTTSYYFINDIKFKAAGLKAIDLDFREQWLRQLEGVPNILGTDLCLGENIRKFESVSSLRVCN
jgi:hypothetical protein